MTAILTFYNVGETSCKTVREFRICTIILSRSDEIQMWVLLTFVCGFVFEHVTYQYIHDIHYIGSCHYINTLNVYDSYPLYEFYKKNDYSQVISNLW